MCLRLFYSYTSPSQSADFYLEVCSCTDSSWFLKYSRINTSLPFVSGDLRGHRLQRGIRKQQAVQMNCRNPPFLTGSLQPLTSIFISFLQLTTVETADAYIHTSYVIVGPLPRRLNGNLSFLFVTKLYSVDFLFYITAYCKLLRHSCAE